ncbi:ABC transporter substrate-binding protein [Glycomyces salinus]|uniref:ABC transporter substrate-binding protein n=1 Tax=Glycomyces salinus TaxID=980294 RepID=UPI0018EC7F8A|nr:ABC transporter substrate-binding protein [Glycomyces salinus]
MQTPAPRTSLAAASAVALSLALAACGSDADAGDAAQSEDGASYPVTVDNCGEEVVIESEPQSILTVGHSAITLLDAAGATDRITARTGEFHTPLPEGLEDPPEDVEVLDPADPAAETIIGAEPDIIVGYGLFEADPATIEAAGIPNLVVTGECNHDEGLVEAITFETVFADIERFGQVFGTEDEAAASIEEYQAELAELEQSAAGDGGTAASVYYWSSESSMSAHGGAGIHHDVLGRAGLENVYGDEDSAYLPANFETLLDADPDYIVLNYGVYGEDYQESLDKFLSEPGAEDLQAVRNDRVIGVPAADLNPDQSSLRGLRALIEALAQ